MPSHTSLSSRLLLVPMLSVGLLLAACGEEDGATDPATSPTPTPTESASPTPTEDTSPTPSETDEAATSAFVYYQVETRAGLRLAREDRELRGDTAVAAVQAMIAGPQDPDYGSGWSQAIEVLGVEQSGDTVTVDLSSEVLEERVGNPAAALMVQQLVWTVTEVTDEAAGVLLTVDGAPATDLWGGRSWTDPVTRDDPMDVRTMVQIDSPTEGATVSSPLTVEGEANAFEANVLWRVLDESGAVVQEGFTTAAEAMTFAPFSFEVELEPGTYTVEVAEDDPSGGEGGEPMTDTRTVTIQ